jgi:hypothetical protein
MKNIKKIAVAVCAVIMSAFLGNAILAWTEPSQTPPSGNAFVPLNSGPITQTMNAYLNIIGNVGIGTTNPAVKKLEVAGDAKSTRFCLGSGTNERCCSTWSQCFCTAKTCAVLGKHCGIVNDGCGMNGMVNCGDCGGDWCNNGNCVSSGGGGGGGGSSVDCTTISSSSSTVCHSASSPDHGALATYTLTTTERCSHCSMQFKPDGFPLGVQCYYTTQTSSRSFTVSCH